MGGKETPRLSPAVDDAGFAYAYATRFQLLGNVEQRQVARSRKRKPLVSEQTFEPVVVRFIHVNRYHFRRTLAFVWGLRRGNFGSGGKRLFNASSVGGYFLTHILLLSVFFNDVSG
jgi:hypothetical protein